MEKINNITPFEEDLSKWYSDLLIQAELIQYGPVKGTLFYQPYAFKIWDLIRKKLTKKFDALGIEEVYFPLLMPYSLIEKEKQHIKGFSPELLKITKVGDEDLSDPIIVRPTSEMLFNIFFKEKLQSYKQLPYKLNQWVNIVRWEKNTRPFLRTSEFLWQEGHTNHLTLTESINFAKKMIDVYEAFCKSTLNLAVIKGEKTNSERFAGADNSFTIETLLKDGQFLQSGTSHNLGQNFTKSLDVKVLDSENKMINPFQTSWGVSTRLIGAILMTHSDNKGLVLPHGIAPYEIVILTVYSKDNTKVNEIANSIKHNLEKKFRVKLDDSNKGIGFKSKEWEVKGAPIRIEVGPRDLEEDKVVLTIRNKDDKQTFKIQDITLDNITSILTEYSISLQEKANKNLDSNKVEIHSIEEIEKVVNNKKYALAFWKENSNLESSIKEKTGATIRCIIKAEKTGKCIHSGELVDSIAIIARAY